MDFNNKTVLITGGAGFIGSNIAMHIQENYSDAKIVVFDRFRNKEKFSNNNLKYLGSFNNLIGFKGIIISGDITNKEDLDKLNNFKFDIIFHEAAVSDTTAKDESFVTNVNINGFKNIVDLALKNNSILVYASSAATYGSSKIFSVGYEKPSNVYGFSKLMMDNLAKIYSNKLRIVGLRYFNVYGPREFYKGKTASMVLQFGLQLLRGESAKLFVKSDEIKRDFIYVKDVVQANVKACDAKNGVYNVGTGKARSFQDIVNILKKELNIIRKDVYIPNPYEKQYQFFTEADISLTKKELKYEPEYSLEQGIHDYIPEIKRIHNKIN